MASSSNISNIRLQPRVCNCGRTAAIRIVKTNENGNEGRLFFVCPSRYSKTPTPHCNYFKFVDEDDEDVTSRIRTNYTACDGITVQDFNDVRTRLHSMETDYGRRLQRMERNIKAMMMQTRPDQKQTRTRTVMQTRPADADQNRCRVANADHNRCRPQQMQSSKCRPQQMQTRTDHNHKPIQHC
ncbi:unnamed protein product [Camellia sinensis]